MRSPPYLTAGLLLLLPAASTRADEAALLSILQGELTRNFKVLKESSDPPPYFLAYQLTDLESHVISATLGALESDTTRRSRILDVTVRVGAPELDNYRATRSERPRFTFGAQVPLEDDPRAICHILWLETDRVYKRAAQRLINIKTQNLVNLTEDDAPADFSLEEPSRHIEPVADLKFAANPWIEKLRRFSREFTSFPEIISSQVSLAVHRDVRRIVNTEGAGVSHGRHTARLQITAIAKASDGMDLHNSESFEAADPSGLPGDEEVMTAIRRLASTVTKMAGSPVVEPYLGPAILSGRAAGVFFHEIFGHRIEGHRQKDVSEGQTFAKSAGTSVLPDFLSVIFDPTRRNAAGTELLGWYLYDDEGVKARPVPIVEQGVMKTFLLSRSPVRGFPHSNGHGRRQPGLEVVSRQSNLIVESTNTAPEDKLRAMLIDELKRQNKPYGYYFENITGGYTMTSRRSIEAWKVIPLVVYRIYSDGRADELVRGADIVGTPLSSFSKIIATGDQPSVFNGFCGAESGDVPVSAVSPALLISELEIQKKATSQDRPPILPRPPQSGESP
jgi:predicted Zn-dependent protease